MKKFTLKKWYPSLHKDWVVGVIVIPWGKQEDYYHIPNKSTTIYKEEIENNPDFWELIEEREPLFITEDRVKITDRMQSVIAIDSDINVDYTRYQWANKKHLIFGSKEGADEYIWRNKPVFSYEEIAKRASQTELYYLETLAKERIKG